MGAELSTRMLVVRLGAIGDVTNALVFATAVKEHAPSVRIGWAVHELAHPLVDGHPSVDRVHLWRKRSGVAGMRALVTELRAERYELAVDLQRITKSAIVARASGAPRVLGYDRRRAKEGSWLWSTERIPPGAPRAHMVEHYLDFARHLGVPNPRARHLFPPDSEADAWAGELVTRLGAPPVVVNVGASKPENLWAPERFGALAAELRGRLDRPIVLSGSERDRGAAARVVARAPEAGILDLTGETSLRRLVALCARAGLFIGCDTGPMHIAAACRTPVVALFGPADPRRTGPFGPGHRVVRAAPHDDGAGGLPPARMEDVSVEMVLDAALELAGDAEGR